ncbi:MAG: DUF1566 domain-containing protein [Candidatus Marinimicrobia bacterium]|nr:DUF1566 domain-containing protein [Candidatus Neomarinimicrobiota bacterium]
MKYQKKIQQLGILSLVILLLSSIGLQAQSYQVVDTGQILFYDNEIEISAPAPGEAFFGQDANIVGNQPSYTDNGDGTVTDNVTGLMWQQSADLNGDGFINIDDKLSQAEALAGADTFSLAGYDDWRLPSIKEAYSLFMMSGEDPSGYEGTDTEGLTPFINTDFFDIDYGDTDAGERIIDAQFASTSLYVSTTMNGDETMFGVNFVDGRIKGYPTGPMPGQTEDKQFYVLYVRGNEAYGQNGFVDNGDSTISDQATDLMWMQFDSEAGMDWEAALAWAQTKNTESYLGYSDWRLPDVKELHSILDYSRSPATTNSAAIDSVFDCTMIVDEGDAQNYPFYWSSSTHANMHNGAWGAYVCFGEALGFMADPFPPFDISLLDVHGAGAQRSDPKTGSVDDYPQGHGPQGDVVRIDNFVRLVRNIETTTGLQTPSESETPTSFSLGQVYPNPFNPETNLQFSMDKSGMVNLSVYNLMGQLVVTLANGPRSAGTYSIKFNASEFPSGVYIYRLQVNGMSSSKRMLLIK